MTGHSTLIAGAMMTAAFFAIPAHAADTATLGCVAARLSAADRAAVVASATQLARRQTNTFPPPLRTAVDAAATACAKLHRWSDKATAAAEEHTLAVLAQPAIAAVIHQEGNDPATVDRVIRNLPAPVRAGIVTKRPDAIQAYATALQKAGVTFAPQTGEVLGVEAATLILSDESLRSFAAN